MKINNLFLGTCTGPLPDMSQCVTENYFSYFSYKTYVVGTQKNPLDETRGFLDGSFEHPKNMFKLMDNKIISILH